MNRATISCLVHLHIAFFLFMLCHGATGLRLGGASCSFVTIPAPQKLSYHASHRLPRNRLKESKNKHLHASPGFNTLSTTWTSKESDTVTRFVGNTAVPFSITSGIVYLTNKLLDRLSYHDFLLPIKPFLCTLVGFRCLRYFFPVHFYDGEHRHLCRPAAVFHYSWLRVLLVRMALSWKLWQYCDQGQVNRPLLFFLLYLWLGEPGFIRTRLEKNQRFLVRRMPLVWTLMVLVDSLYVRAFQPVFGPSLPPSIMWILFDTITMIMVAVERNAEERDPWVEV